MLMDMMKTTVNNFGHLLPSYEFSEHYFIDNTTAKSVKLFVYVQTMQSYPDFNHFHDIHVDEHDDLCTVYEHDKLLG